MKEPNSIPNLPDSMFDFVEDCRGYGYEPSIQEFREAFADHPEADWFADELELPLEREELQGEVTDEIFQKPLTLRQEYASRGLKLTDFY